MAVVDVRNDFSSYLLSEGLLNKDNLTQIKYLAAKNQVTLIRQLFNCVAISHLQLAKALAYCFQMRFVNLDVEYKTYHNVLPIKLIKQHLVLPLYQQELDWVVAIADPLAESALAEVKFNLYNKVTFVIAEYRLLSEKIKEISLQQGDASLENALSVESDSGGLIVNYVEQILQTAIDKRASDIHFESYKEKFRIRLRVNGVLQECSQPPNAAANQISIRLKVLANLDIAEKRLPQDGHFSFSYNELATDFRISTCPTIAGEKIVLRIVNSKTLFRNISQLGLFGEQMELLKYQLNKLQGLILVTGSTGSGKTVTLYSALDYLNNSETNIVTVEDPVEMEIENLNQVSIAPKYGLDFSKVLKSFLRQDPDVIMIGEIRDVESAEIALQAAQTGHLVLATLHTNNCIDSLLRLQHMGLKIYNIASSVSLIIAQRLVRKLCVHCRQETILSPQHKRHLNLLADAYKIYEPKGCSHCDDGFSGRIAVFECLPMNDELIAAMFEKANSQQLKAIAEQQGFRTISENAIALMLKGTTSYCEISKLL